MEVSQQHSQSMSLSLQFVPNYPPGDPVFYVPRLPDVSTVHEPLPPKRPPPVGYDLKTLRKQIEYLQEELTERTKNHNSLFSQNEQLWQYVQELLEANKFNASQMRDRVTKLNEELRVAQKERYLLLEKLDMAKNSKKMLLDLEKELEEAQVGVEEIQRRKQDAERELRQARSEREELESTLNTHLEQLQGCEDLLEQYRMKEKEDADMDRADDFFFSNRAVLKAAYLRFKNGVVKRTRMTSIQRILQQLYRRLLINHCLSLWKGFLRRQRFVKFSRARRDFEITALSFKRWKVFMALELLFHRAERKKLLTLCLGHWKQHVQEVRFNAWAEMTTQDWKLKCFKRKFFRAWRGQVMFIGWCDRSVEAQVPFAAKHFKHKLFAAWKAVTKREITKAFGLAVVITHNFKRLRFRAWHSLCRRQWTSRGRLLRRFFRHVTSAIEWRNHNIVQAKTASAMWISLKKRMMLRRWRLFVRGAARRLPLQDHRDGSRHHIVVVQKAQTIRRHHHYRALTTSFLTILLRATNFARQRISLKVAKRHFASTMVFKWQRWARKQVVRRREKHFLAKQFAFKRWLGQMTANRQTAMLRAGITELQRRNALRRQNAALISWVKIHVHHRRARNLGAYLENRVYREKLGRCFRLWRTRWFREVFWRQKELSIDLERAQSLQRLTLLSLERHGEEARKLEAQNGQLEETLMNLQEMLADHKNKAEQQQLTIQRNEKTKIELQEHLVSLESQLKELEEEKERWDALELTLEQERLQQEMERERRKKEAETRVLTMREESERMRRELLASHEAEIKLLDEQTAHASAELKELQSQVDEADEVLRDQEGEVRSLEDEQELLTRELARIQKKVQQVVSDGDTLREENERQLRRRMGELKVAEADAGVAQARVMALYDLLEEQQQDRGRMHMAEVSLHETREAEDLLQKRRDFEVQMSTLRQLYPSTPLLDTQPLWDVNAPREDLVNLASPLSTESEVSYVHDALLPSKPQAPDSAFKRQRYGGPSSPPKERGTSVATASTALPSPAPGLTTRFDRPVAAPAPPTESFARYRFSPSPPRSPPRSTAPPLEPLVLPSPLPSRGEASPSSTSSVSSRAPSQTSSHASSRPLASLSDRASSSAAPPARSDDLADPRDAIRALTQRLKSRLNETL